jgi:hypothetical protein
MGDTCTNMIIPGAMVTFHAPGMSTNLDFGGTSWDFTRGTNLEATNENCWSITEWDPYFDLDPLDLPSGKLTNKKLWKITIFNGKIHYKWLFSIANWQVTPACRIYMG